MTFNELLKRRNGFYYSPPVDDQGADPDAELNEETDEEREAREAQEAEDQRIADLVEARAQQLHTEAVERKAAELQARLQAGSQPQADPNEAYRERLRAIAYETDPERQEEMRLQLAEERVATRFQSQLAHSAYEGAVQSVIAQQPDIPENVKPFVAKAIRAYNVTPDQVSTLAGAQQVRRLAMGMAAEEGALNPAPAPAPRTPTLRPAPVTQQTRTSNGSLAHLNDKEKQAVNAQWNSLPASMREGKRLEDIFSADDIAEICAEVR